MVSDTKMIFINAPVEKVFAFVADPSNLVGVMPGMEEVRNIRPSASGGSDYEWTFRMAGMKLDGMTEMTRFTPNQRIDVASKGGVESYWNWIFEEKDGGTDLTVKLDYSVPIPVLGKLAEAMIVKQNEQNSFTHLANIKARVEATEKAPTG